MSHRYTPDKIVRGLYIPISSLLLVILISAMRQNILLHNVAFPTEL
jgi:hypothetical protein